MLGKQEVKTFAKECGADLVGIASMDRFEGAPKQLDPRYIFPEAKAMIVFGFRVLRGCYRGIEEGTFFIGYSGMGYAGVNWVYAPMTLWRFCRALEDEGYEAVPMPNIDSWTNTNLHTRDPQGGGAMRPEWSRPVSPDKPAPDVFVHFRIAAFCAGLGEIGYSKIFLTPEFGPRQRFAAVLTDAPLDPDPLYSGPPLCDRCMLCARDCAGQAISQTETVRATVAGRELEWGKIDVSRCSSKQGIGGGLEYNPFIATPEERAAGSVAAGKIKPVYEYGKAIEGARGCVRACMVHLEGQGKISNAFNSPFRKRKPWKLG